MKTIIQIFFFFYLIPTAILSQTIKKENFIIYKGKILISGNLNVSGTNQTTEYFDFDSKETNNTKTSSIQPSIGYTIKNNFELGLLANFQQSTTETENSNTATKGWGLSPYLTKYYSLGPKLSIHIRCMASYFESEDRSESFLEEVNKNEIYSVFIGAVPGLTLKINNKLALQTQIGSFGFTHFTNVTDEVKTVSSNFGADLNLSLSEFNFGILLIL